MSCAVIVTITRPETGEIIDSRGLEADFVLEAGSLRHTVSTAKYKTRTGSVTITVSDAEVLTDGDS